MLHGMRPFLLLALAPALIGLHTGNAGASPPRCTPAQEGAVACLDSKLCECRYEPGGTLTGRRAGTRWNCGALRPTCGAATMPADVGPPAERMLPPPSLYPAPYGAQPGWR
jgi:hypothetical protein